MVILNPFRRDPFRDRRSILEQNNGPFQKSLASEILKARLKEEKSRARHGRRHGHGDYKRRKEEEALKETILESDREYLESINERTTSESRSSNLLTDLNKSDNLERASEGKVISRYPNVFSNITDNKMLKPKRSRSRRPRKKSGKKKRLRRKNNTENSGSRSRNRTKNKNERRKNRNRSRGKNREGRRSCRGLKGAEKRECRKKRKNHQGGGSEKVDPQISIMKQSKSEN